MVKQLAIICAAFVLSSCVSNRSATAVSEASTMADNFLITLPRPGALIIIGVSGHLQNPEDEIDAAREDAARKAAMYHGINASYESIYTVGSSIFDYQVKSNFTLEYDRELEQYMDKLAFDPNRDMATNNRAVFIRFTYPTAFPGSISYGFVQNEDGRPVWTTNRPKQINGLVVGVGYAARQSRQQDTFIKSYEAALAEIVTQLSVIINTETISDGWNNTSTINMHGKVNLSNFLVLEIWIDPKTQAVWTLAVAHNTE